MASAAAGILKYFLYQCLHFKQKLKMAGDLSLASANQSVTLRMNQTI